MRESHPTTTQPEASWHCELRIKGHLDDRWTNYFEGFNLTREDSGETQLCGPIVDQAELYGLLRKVRDLGLPLLSVVLVANESTP